MSRAQRLALLGSLLCGSGCSAIPTGREPPARLPDAGAPTTHRLAVAPVQVRLGAGERAKGYAIGQVVDAADVQREMAAWAEASGAFASVKRLPAATRERDVLREAWNRREDLVLELAIDRIQTRFKGHNGWWIPNITNWIAWMVPA